MRLILALGLAALVGCGGKGGNELPVSGTVTVDGTPASEVTVRFFPDGDTDVTSSGYAVTGSDGKYVLIGGKNKTGLVPGRYKVTVSKGKPPSTSADSVGAVVPGLDIKDDFPDAYSDLAKTKLAYSVTGDGKPIDIAIDLKKKK
jgi:hypothetical protein